jgi:tRNA nucleotidyltransferase (CCA-adding enzyme)
LKTIKRRLKQTAEVRNSELYAWFKDLNLEMLLYLASRASSEQVRRFVSSYLTRLRAIAPLLDGEDLLKLGLTPGPQFRRIMERLLQARLDGEVNSRDEELALTRTLAQGRPESVIPAKSDSYKKPA